MSAVGFGAVQVAEPENVITAGPMALVANEVKAVEMYPGAVAVDGPKTAVPAATPTTGTSGASAFFRNVLPAVFFFRKVLDARLVVKNRCDARLLVRSDPASDGDTATAAASTAARATTVAARGLDSLLL